MATNEFTEAVSDLEDYFTSSAAPAGALTLADLSPESRLHLTVEPGRRVRDLNTGGFGNVVAGTRRFVLIRGA